MEQIRFFNTLKGCKEDFVPLDAARVCMYVCGPTVYSRPHIGNARAAVVFDVLYRLLRSRYPRVDYVRNITDVDDKINDAAAREGVSIQEIAERYSRAYHEDTEALGVLLPTAEPRVTGHIPDIIDMIQRLLVRKHAYQAQGHVLFDVSSAPDYGCLSGRSRDQMIAGARVEVAPFKRDPADFVLWKPSAADQPAWSSPWGSGRPGWHIECSTLVERCLGESIDIHGGGQDLIFPHHENELAQSRCAHDGREFCRYWLHNGLVRMQNDKMSKSLGNVLILQDLLHQAPGEVIRYALLATHYRSPLDWSGEVLEQARHRLDRLYGTLRDADLEGGTEAQPPPPEFRQALSDDLNTPLALHHLHQLAREANRSGASADQRRLAGSLRTAGALLGLLQRPPAGFREWDEGVNQTQVEVLLAQRSAARRDNDYKEADRLRDELRGMGVQIQDRDAGTVWWRE